MSNRKRNTKTRSRGRPRYQSRDPHAMSTSVARGARDPPQTATNVVGNKRLRKIVNITDGNGTLSLSDVVACLPFSTNNTEFRILKLSVWGPDFTTAGFTQSLSCVFPVATIVASPLIPTPGDNSAWEDDGTQGQSRAQLHLTPNFGYRTYWLSQPRNGIGALIASFSLLPLSTASQTLLVDISVQYRTVPQLCPAAEHLRQLQRTIQTE
jgi:hypothetical protein